MIERIGVVGPPAKICAREGKQSPFARRRAATVERIESTDGAGRYGWKTAAGLVTNRYSPKSDDECPNPNFSAHQFIVDFREFRFDSGLRILVFQARHRVATGSCGFRARDV